MLGLSGFWGQLATKSYMDGRHSSVRSQYLSSLELNNNCESSPVPSEYSSTDRSRQYSVRRSPSLPPISSPEKRVCLEDDRDVEVEHDGEEAEGEGEEGGTSGYASDTGVINDNYHHQQQEATHAWVGQRGGHSWQPNTFVRRSPDSITSTDMGRPRWGDKGVGVGHLWAPTPHNPDARLPQVSDRPGATPPAWLHRRLNKLEEPAQILVISHPDDTRSPKDFRGSCDSINSSECTRTYLRGQNIPLEPEELAEREMRRQKAMEHQNAIRQQLEERERKKKDEKDLRLLEERREEERLKKQQEIERLRIEEEQRRQKEKEEKEERKAAAMREALENAERLAREEKIRERRRHVMERANELNESLRRVHLDDKEDQPRLAETQRKLKFHPREPREEIPMRKENSTSFSTESDDGTALSMNIVLAPQEIPPNQLSVIVSPGRLLTPSKFRQRERQHASEKSTQTECKLEDRSSKQLRYRNQPLKLEDRPKWGVNRPDIQYIKQSDRDPYRLRRFVNTKLRCRPINQHVPRSPSPSKNSVSSGSNSQLIEESSKTQIKPSTTANRATSTPRIMQMVLQSSGSVRKSSAGRPRYLTVKGGIGSLINGNAKRRVTNRVRQHLPVKPIENIVGEKTEIVSVQDVLDQLTSLRKGLSLKQHEWEVSRSQTPFSELSSRS